MSTLADTASTELTYVTDSQVCSDNAWEEAYRRFESPAEEIEKFCSRLSWFGADKWDRNLEIVELFCGRGNALVAWQQLGFTQLEGVDLSATLLSEYQGPAKCYVADCRELPFEDNSKDVLAVHGGLHHLPALESDLATALDEAVRVLRPGGQMLVVEPWNTPFLQMVHLAAATPAARRAWDKLDAFQELYVHEQETYDRWRKHPELIFDIFTERFKIEHCRERWGKLYFLGQKPIGK